MEPSKLNWIDVPDSTVRTRNGDIETADIWFGYTSGELMVLYEIVGKRGIYSVFEIDYNIKYHVQERRIGIFVTLAAAQSSAEENFRVKNLPIQVEKSVEKD